MKNINGNYYKHRKTLPANFRQFLIADLANIGVSIFETTKMSKNFERA